MLNSIQNAILLKKLYLIVYCSHNPMWMPKSKISVYMIITGPVVVMGFPRNSYSPFPQIVQVVPAGTPQFPVPVVPRGKNLQCRVLWMYNFGGPTTAEQSNKEPSFHACVYALKGLISETVIQHYILCTYICTSIPSWYCTNTIVINLGNQKLLYV